MQSEKYAAEDFWKELFSFLVETMETAVKSWHETSKVDPRVYFLLDKEKTQTDKYAPVVNIDQVLDFRNYVMYITTFRKLELNDIYIRIKLKEKWFQPCIMKIKSFLLC